MPESVNGPPPDADEAALLDAYLEGLHSGARPDRQRLVAEHPELAGLLDCLDALAELSVEPPPAPGALTSPFIGELSDLPPIEPALQQFGKYELLRELGKGGMGVVYLARQRDLDRLVALMLIRGSHLAGPEPIDRFQTEARTAARLRHPNVVAVYEAGVIDDQHYIAMQYVEGRGLDQVLRERVLKPEEAAAILVQVVRAVAYLHDQGLLHRDLKPGNILLDGRVHPYLTDFGLAKLLDGDSRLTQSGAVVGTPSYMPPEQAAGRGEVGVPSDVWALGAILYEMLTGRPPFRAETPLQTLVLVMESEPTLPRRLRPGLPRELELICLKCLDKAPERRYPSAAALADDLDRFLRGEAVEARPRGPLQALLRWTRREPALASRVIVLGVFLVLTQVHYLLYPELVGSAVVHYAVVGVGLIWLAVSWVCQRLLDRPKWTEPVQYLWAGGEPFLLTALLALTQTAGGPFLIVYPLMVAAAGLWFRVPLVWVVTLTAEAAFGLLVLVCPELRSGFFLPTLLFPVFLLAVGAVVAQQVQRVRILSRHYNGRPLP